MDMTHEQAALLLRQTYPSLNTEANRKLLINNHEHVDDLIHALTVLHTCGILDNKYSELLANNVSNAKTLSQGLEFLHKVGILNDTNTNLLVQNLSFHQVNWAISILFTMRILDETTFQVLMSNVDHAQSLTRGFMILHNANIFNAFYRNLLVENAEHAEVLAKGLIELFIAEILDNHLGNLLASRSQYAMHLASGLLELNRADILANQYIHFLVQNAQHANSLGLVLVELHNQEILTYLNFHLICAKAHFTALLAPGLSALRAVDILNDPNFITIIHISDDINFAECLAKVLVAMNRATILDQGKFNYLMLIPQVMMYLSWGLPAMQNARILTNTNFNLLIDRIEHIQGLSLAFVHLKRANLLNSQTFARVMDNSMQAMIEAQFIISESISRATAKRSACLRLMPLKTMPATNQRQRRLAELNIDIFDEKINKFIDPVTLEAIEYPQVLDGDETGAFFEFNTLMYLQRDGDDFFSHPLTRQKFNDSDIKDATTIYSKAFDRAVKTFRC